MHMSGRMCRSPRRQTYFDDNGIWPHREHVSRYYPRRSRRSKVAAEGIGAAGGDLDYRRSRDEVGAVAVEVGRPVDGPKLVGEGLAGGSLQEGGLPSTGTPLTVVARQPPTMTSPYLSRRAVNPVMAVGAVTVPVAVVCASSRNGSPPASWSVLTTHVIIPATSGSEAVNVPPGCVVADRCSFGGPSLSMLTVTPAGAGNYCYKALRSMPVSTWTSTGSRKCGLPVA
jgi:hypothetical protein